MNEQNQILQVLVDDQQSEIPVDQELQERAESILAQMDRDMDNGWQLSRRFVKNPDSLQRCQIVANRLLTALETDNPAVSALMASYILDRLPGVAAVAINSEGESEFTAFYDQQGQLIG